MIFLVYICSKYGQQFVICTPKICHHVDFTRYTIADLPHEAGYDAYMCGYGKYTYSKCR